MDRLKKIAVLPIAAVALVLLLGVVVPTILLLTLTVGVLKLLLLPVRWLTAEPKRKALQ